MPDTKKTRGAKASAAADKRIPAAGGRPNKLAPAKTVRDVKVAVEGHCDERGTVDYNLALGEQRARATRDYLVSLGVSADRLRVVSYGKERPLAPGRSESAYQKNRRAHFTVSR